MNNAELVQRSDDVECARRRSIWCRPFLIGRRSIVLLFSAPDHKKKEKKKEHEIPKKKKGNDEVDASISSPWHGRSFHVS